MAALYVNSSSELKGSKETPRGATLASLTTAALATVTSKVSTLFASVTPSITSVNRAPALTLKEEALAAYINELYSVIKSALATLAREVRGLLLRDN